jgi:hypothetical protein
MNTSLITITVEVIDNFQQGPSARAGSPAGLFVG